MEERQFYDAIRRHERILFLCHKNADPDSFGSSYALMRLFGGDIAVADSLSAMAETLSAKLKVKTLIRPNLSKYDIVVVVDTSTLVQSGYDKVGRCAVIDHHTPGDLAGMCEFSLSRQASSTAEIVYWLYKKCGVLPDHDVAFALVLAIVTDTGNYRYAKPEAFETVASILRDTGLAYAEISEFLSSMPMDLSCRIALLKASSRISLTREGDYLIVTTKVSSFGSQAATSLIGLGADVVFVGSEKEGEKRISGRARRNVSIDLSAILSDVGKKFGGSGGGHAAAAGVTITGDVDKALKACVDAATQALRK